MRRRPRRPAGSGSTDDEVEPEREGARNGVDPSGSRPSSSSAQAAATEVRRACGGRPSPPASPKSRRRAPADLDDHERRRRARVDRHEVELVATDMDVPGEDGPAGFAQPRADESLGGVTRELRRRSRPSGGLAVHRRMRASRRSPGNHPCAHLALIRRLRRRQLQRIEVGEVEGRVVGHDRQDSRSSSSWVVGDAAGSPSRSRSS